MKTDMMKEDARVPSTKLPQGVISEGTKNPLLARAMAEHGIRTTVNAKGDRLTSFFPKSPKFCFGYTSARGAEWKCSAEQAAHRFN
jgi:hypothetical protein